jgi:hypothetical protein
MSLFNCRVSRSESELMVRYEVGMFNELKKELEMGFFKDFGGNE